MAKRKNEERLEEQRGKEALDKTSPSELPDNKGLPAKHRRPGKLNSKREHKVEKRRKQVEKKAAETHEEE